MQRIHLDNNRGELRIVLTNDEKCVRRKYKSCTKNNSFVLFVQLLIIKNNFPDRYTLVGNDTGTLSIGYNARSQFYTEQTEGRMLSVGPKEGTAAQINVISAIANSNNEEATKTFINYAISPEAQARFAELMFYAPTNTKTVIKAETKNRIPMMNEDRRENLISVDWMAIGELREEMLTLWRRQIIPTSR